MEKSEKNNILLEEIQEEIDVVQDKVISLFLLKNRNKTCVVDRLIRELNILSFEDALCKKYASFSSTRDEICHDKDNAIVWQNLTEDDNYDEVLSNISKCDVLSPEILDELLKIHFIDTRQSHWHDISMKLQECFCSNYSLFLKSLKIHYKIIISQNCCVDGYLSLLKATNSIVKNHLVKYLEEENQQLNNRVFLCLKVILTTELFMLRNIHIANERVIADIVENVIALFSFETNIQEQQIVILDFISLLDEKAEWFKYLCSSGFTKPLLMKVLTKYPNLLRIIFKHFLFPMSDYIGYSNIKNHIHSCNFLVHYFSIHQNMKEFELKTVENRSYNFFEMISLVVNTINNNISLEMRETLKNFITSLFKINPSLINQEILEIFFIPFENVMKENSMKVISSNMFIFELIRLSVRNNNKILTDRYLFNRRKYRGIFNFGQSERNTMSANRNFINIPQLIIDITILLIRNYINTSEKNESVDDNTVLLLECCDNIYHSHPVFLHNVLTSKFIINLSSFYKALNNFQTTREEIEIVLNIFSFFLKYYSNILKLFKDKIFVFNIFNRIISKKIEISSCMIFNNFSNEIFMEDELQVQLHLVTQSFLLSAWPQDIDDTYGNIVERDSFIQLLHFLYGVSHKTNLIRILVTRCHNIDFMKKGVIPIPTILKLSVQNVRNTLETCTGLLFSRIFISNLDGILLLQSNFSIRDNLLKALSHMDYDSDDEIESLNIDLCTTLRKNLLLNIDNIGYPNKLLNNLQDSTNSWNSSGIKVWGIKSGRNCDLQKYLNNTKAAVHDHSWMHQVKMFFYKFSSEGYKVSVVYEIVSQCPKLKDEKICRTWPEPGTWLPQLFREDLVAIAIIVKFGIQNQLLTTGCRHEENLAHLVKQSRVFLNEQSEEFVGYDWFIGICFLVCSGNIERCKSFCVNMFHLPSVNLIWHNYGKTFGNVWLENFYQHLDVLMAENTILYSSLKMGNLNPTMVMEKWLSQCFFNILDFREICNFIIFSVLSPLEGSMYYMLCLFIHNRNSICKITHTPSLENFLNVISLDDFKLSSYVPTINELSTRYKNIIKL